jgi:streptogramin lyase
MRTNGSRVGAVEILKVGAAALMVAATAVAVRGAAALGSSPTMTEFTLAPSSEPGDITLGLDGRIWFSQATGVGAITAGGTITNYPLPSRGDWIEPASDGGLWVTGPGLVRHLTVGGTATTFTLPAGDPTWGDSIGGAVAGPDGNLWYTRWPSTVGKVTPTGTITEYAIPLEEPLQSVMPAGITVGPDGALWFAESWNNRVGRVTTSGAFTMFPLPEQREPNRIAAGPDGNLWFSLWGDDLIGRLTPAGTYAEFPGPGISSFATGADGKLWFGGNEGIGTIAANGTVTDHGGAARSLTRGSGGALWYTTSRNTVGRIDAAPDPRGEFTPLTPARILDTRSGVGRPGNTPGPLGGGQQIEVQLAGRGGVPATGVSAVVLNATVTGPSAPSWLGVFPAGGSVPNVSNLNFMPGTTVANMVTVALGNGGRLGVFNAAGSTHVIFDVVGYYAGAGGTLGARFVGIDPQRAFDTRDGTGGIPAGPLGSGGLLHFKVTGAAGVPATGVTAVVMNLTATGTTAHTWLAAYPDDVPRPEASSLNLGPGATVPNLVTVRVPASGVIDVFNAAGSTHVIGDVMGYYTTQLITNEGRFVPVTPQRVFDSRLGDPGGRNGIPLPGGVTPVNTLDRNPGIATNHANAAAVNITVTQPDGAGWLRAYTGNDCLEPPPAHSNINYAAGQTIPNSVLIQLAHDYYCGSTPDGFSIYQTTSGHVIVDLFGYFTTRTYAFTGGA